MPEGKTIGQLMEEMRQKAGAQNYHGHDYMDLQRFAENTRHMIIFDVLTHWNHADDVRQNHSGGNRGNLWTCSWWIDLSENKKCLPGICW